MQRVAVEETRLGIPLLFAFDVIHGHRTIFPIPLAEAAAFDPVLWERTARAAAIEAAADGLNLIFAPMLDVARDPRWGRIAESPGEDPWVAARFAEAKVRGFEGDDIAHPQNLAATATPRRLRGFGGRPRLRSRGRLGMVVPRGVPAAVPRRRGRWRRGDHAGVHGPGRVPMTANAAVLRKLVRERWRFDGVIVSDHGAIRELIAHGVAGEDGRGGGAGSARRRRHRPDERCLCPRAAARPRARPRHGRADRCRGPAGPGLKARLGLFDDPYHRSDAALAPPGQMQMHRDLARDAARPLDRAADQPGRSAAVAGCEAADRGDRAARRCSRRHARALGGAPAAPRTWSRSSRACARRCQEARSATRRASRSKAARRAALAPPWISRAQPMSWCSAWARRGG